MMEIVGIACIVFIGIALSKASSSGIIKGIITAICIFLLLLMVL